MRWTQIAGTWIGVLVVTTQLAHAAIRYVDDSAPAGGNGTSWALAYNSLQTALGVVVANDEIRVGQGTYKPGAPGAARTVTFTLPNGVRLRGSFRGFGSPSPDTQDIVLYPTILNGDLQGNDTAPGTYTNSGENCYHVVTINGSVSNNTRLEGLIIERGFANVGDQSATTSRGGGVWCNGACVLNLISCTVRYNFAVNHGGGFYMNAGTLTCNATIFDTNRAVNTVGGPFFVGFGGGMYCLGAVATIDVNSQFKNNLALRGAGFYGSGSIANTRFDDNSAFEGAGGIHNPGGTLTVNTCIFDGNHANEVGVLSVVGGVATIINSQFTDNGELGDFLTIYVSSTGSLTMETCTITGSQSFERTLRSEGTLYLFGCTITKNTSNLPTLINDGGSATLDNCIFGGNLHHGGSHLTDIHNKGFMRLIGSTSADIVNTHGGTFAPSGPAGDLTAQATLIGLFDQNNFGSGGNLETQIGGGVPGVSHDRLHINGNADLAGGLVISLVDGFDPPVGSCYTVFEATGTVTGQFNVVYTPPMFDKFFRTNAAGGCASFGSGGGTISVVGLDELLNFSAGVFPISGDATAVEVADFDGVNGDDVAVTLTNGVATPGSLLILLNDGTGLNFTVASFPVGNDPSALAIGHLDANATLDVAVANRGSAGGGTVSILVNNGSGVFSTLGGAIGVGTNLSAIAAADLNGLPLTLGSNGDELAVCVVGSNSTVNGTLRILNNNGAGAYSNGPLLPTGPNPSAVDPSDVDNDRDIDLITAHATAFANGPLIGLTSVGVFVNTTGTGTFPAARNDLEVGKEPVDVTTGDLNGDSLDDIVTANKATGDANGTVSVLLNTSSNPGTFGAAATLAVGADARAVELVKVDNDSDLDIVVLAEDAGSPALQVLTNYTDPGNTGGTVDLTLTQSRAVGDNASDIAKGNLNNAGAEDVATLDEGGTPLAQGGGGTTLGASDALSLIFNSSDAPGQIQTVFSDIATSFTSLVPPGGSLTSLPLGTRFASFDRPYRSPNGQRWCMSALTDLASTQDEILIAGDSNGSSVIIQEGVAVPFSSPIENFGPFDRNMGIRDDGDVAFSTNTNGPTASDEYVLEYHGSGIGLWWQEGLTQVPGVATESFGSTIDSVHASRAGFVGLRAPSTVGSAPDSQDDFLIIGLSITARSGVTIPTGQAGGTTFPWETFDADAFYTSNSMTTYIAKGDLATGTTAADDVVVVNNQVRLQEGVIIAGSGFTSPIASAFPGAIIMSANGDWFARGSNVDAQDWTVRNGAVIARTDQAVTPGSSELFDDAVFTNTFYSMKGNNAGDWVIGGATNAVDPMRNNVLVFNGIRIIVREGDRVDLNNNGLPDDDVFISDFNSDDCFLTEERILYFEAVVRNGVGAVIGEAFLRTRIDPAPACNANIAGASGSGQSTVNVDDLLAVINAWGPCADPNNCPADIAPPGGNNTVNVDDLLAVINSWGACP